MHISFFLKKIIDLIQFIEFVSKLIIDKYKFAKAAS